MTEKILQKIESLPPLPKTIIEIEEFRKKQDKELNELLKIIEKDALIVSTLLKIANSAMFGFRTKVESPSRALSLLGINFTVSIAIGGSIQNLLSASLKPYGISSDDFMKGSNIASSLANNWLSRFEVEYHDDIVLASFLQEVGKFVLSSIIISDGKEEEFLAKVEESSVKEAEYEFLETSTAKVTAQIFRHWKLSDNLINLIDSVDDISTVEPEFKQRVQILDVIKTAANVIEPLSDKNIAKALEKAKAYEFDISILKSSIDELKNKLAQNQEI
ncbi:HDOD domain-containing protein [Aliarcobacter cibarius]|jgi:HD-like signal output (HDOD) protein|uniref:HDOD domain-containing protein n=1 Tax=Aliarcobacter cibarius TaxID=255507 RepID=A0A5J6RJF3_9BACT|nr:HDOD domain-containing protein [Aliarcobacter cibarius]QEZ89527.1 HDOD domain-containing protein [Aliarcobacter cibarius]QKJ27527.1 HDOD domain-containing protein [Aliarcobacter cibarius]TLS99225.1 HDOD domain-containing protein [Aliarcobacter cibarius]TLT00368.1 HDOD domain-containing protein [Aliarcobacter cibarius]TLT04416.1 HDOD domain-containing protein [Aliarcobacter cibarius]